MNTYTTPIRHFALTLIGTAFLTGTALAGPSSTNADADADAQARYRQDLAFCNSGQSSQPLNVCRTEARNALAEAKRGGLSDSPGQYSRNAVQRCAEFQGDERTACEARVFNPSRVEGSVEGGGLLRESIIVVPGK